MADPSNVPSTPLACQIVTDRLAPSDPHHWGPVPEVVKWLNASIPADAKVLEIGPGTAPFRRADVFVDFVDIAGVPKEKMVKCDIATEKLPFADKEFDFVVCRHTLEDMYNPFPVCAEMSRVAKGGYLETPSPVAELSRGVDGGDGPYRGYHHHRFIGWASDGEFRLISKYPLVEYLKLDDAKMVSLLRWSAMHWNSYHLWDGELTVRHVQSPLDYDIPREYTSRLKQAVEQSIVSANVFWSLL